MTSPRRLAAVSGLCGSAVLAAFIAAVLVDFSSRKANTDAAIQETRAASVGAEAPIEGGSQAASASTGADSIDVPQTTASDEDGVAVSDAAIAPPPPPEIPAVQVASTSAPDPVQGGAQKAIADASPDALPLPSSETPAVQIASPSTPDPVQAGASEVVTADASSDALPLPPETPAVQSASTSTPQPVQGDAKEVTPVDTSSGPRPPQPEAPAVQTASASTPDPVQGSAKEVTPADAVSDAFPLPPPETPAVQIASLSTAEPVQGPAKEETGSVEIFDECLVVEPCIDRYLFALYERTPKLDTNKVRQQTKVTVKKKGKTRTVTKTLIKLVDNDFTWKDPKAADRVRMSLIDYVIGGMDRRFKVKLYHALRAMDEAGLVPGITSGFRDNYRQSIATGQKAASDSSYHGGSRRGGYGHGLAADIVSVKGATRDERWRSSEVMWKWVDAHGAEFGIGRPYLDRDPPHVGPIDGQEYADKRGRARTAHTKQAGLANRRHRSAGHDSRGRAKRATTASAKSKST